MKTKVVLIAEAVSGGSDHAMQHTPNEVQYKTLEEADDFRGETTLDSVSWEDIWKSKPTKIEVPDGARVEFGAMQTLFLRRAFVAGETGNANEEDRWWKAFFLAPALVLRDVTSKRGGRRGRNDQLLGITEKIQFLRGGHWDLAIDDGDEALRPDKRAKTGVPDDAADYKRRAHEIEACIAAGEIGKALGQVVRGAPMAEPSVTSRELPLLFPGGAGSMARAAPSVLEGQDLTAVKEQIRTILTKSPKRSAPGLKGMRYEHVKIMAAAPGGEDLLV